MPNFFCRIFFVHHNSKLKDKMSEFPTGPLQDSSNCQNQSNQLMTLDEIRAGVFSDDFNLAFKATQHARKMLSRERNPPIDSLIDLGEYCISDWFLNQNFKYPYLFFNYFLRCCTKIDHFSDCQYTQSK